MEQRDYLQRQIDDLGRVLGKVFSDLLGLKNQGQLSQGIELTDQTLKEETDFDIEELAALPAEKFVDTLREKKKFGQESFDRLADILLLIADELNKREPGNERSKTLYAKCLKIYAHLEKTDLVDSYDRHLKAARIKKLL